MSNTSSPAIETSAIQTSDSGNSGDNNNDRDSIVLECLRAFGDGLENQVNGTSQLMNRISGSHLPEIDFVGTPEPKGEVARVACQISGALSMVPAFFAVSKGFGAVAPISLLKSPVCVGAVTGGSFDFVTHHVDNANVGNFWTDRAQAALIGAATFGGMYGVSSRLRAAMMPDTAVTKSIATITGGTVAGGINAESEAVIKHGRLATGQELMDRTRDFAMVAGALGAMHGIGGKHTATPEVKANYDFSQGRKLLTNGDHNLPTVYRAPDSGIRDAKSMGATMDGKNMQGLIGKGIEGKSGMGAGENSELTKTAEYRKPTEKRTEGEVFETPVRVSVANIVPSIRVKETGEFHYFGILNRKKLAKGERTYAALGGAVEMTEQGAQVLAGKHNAKFQEGADARFIVDAKSVPEVFDYFSKRNSAHYETDAVREVKEELGKIELAGQKASILTAEDLASVKLQFIKTMPQTTTKGTSAREGDVATRRLFYVSEMEVPQRVFDKLKQSQYIRFLKENEIESGRTADGAEVADNIVKI